MPTQKRTRSRRTLRTPKKEPVTNRVRALRAYRELGTVAHACKKAKIGRQTWYDWLEKDPAFAAEVRDTKVEVKEDLEGVAVERAKDGSDTLLIFLLKSLEPEKYRDTQKLEIVSPKVRDRMRRTIDVIRSALPPDQGEQILKQLDEVWR